MTSTRTYRVDTETVRIPAILWAGIFEVPWHQREFDWDTEQVEQFWDDIHRNVERNEPDYFISDITLTQENQRTFHIQDGQQRLTTYSLMLAVLRPLVPEEHRSRIHSVIYDIEHGAMPTATTDVRIKHQMSDRNKYSMMMQGETFAPNGKLSQAYDVLTKKASQLSQEQSVKLLDYLLTSVIANKTINRTDNATQVFETLNNRGKEVDDVDLLRNFLYSHLTGPRNNTYEQIHENLEAMKREAHDPRQFRNKQRLFAYVQCALECRYGPIRRNYLYKDAMTYIQGEIDAKGKVQAVQTVRDITEYLCDQNHINAFIILYKGNYEASEFTDFVNSAGTRGNRRNMRDYIRELSEYSAASLPVTFAALSRFLKAPSSQRAAIARAGHRVVQSLNAMIMRTAVLQPRFAPSVIEEDVARWGKEVMETIGNETQRKVCREIMERNPENVFNDSEFQERLRHSRFPQTQQARKKVRLMLFALYQQMQSDLQTVGSLTLEHVLPDSAEHLAGWGPHFNADNHERYAFMLGNMTLLSPSDNKGTAGFNESFANKKAVFANSTIQENRDIAANNKWTPNTVTQRQHRLAEIACEAWKPHATQ